MGRGVFGVREREIVQKATCDCSFPVKWVAARGARASSGASLCKKRPVWKHGGRVCSTSARRGQLPSVSSSVVTAGSGAAVRVVSVSCQAENGLAAVPQDGHRWLHA